MIEFQGENRFLNLLSVTLQPIENQYFLHPCKIHNYK